MCVKLFLQWMVLAVLFLHAQQTDVSYRIIGGEPVTTHKYRYYVRLNYGGGLRCGGSLVRNNAVVTAAHCVQGVSASRMTIHADSISLSDNGVRRGVKRVLVSSAFRESTLHYDVAVLILESAIPSDKFQAIALNSAAISAGTNCRIIGHGSTKENGNVANQLQEATVSVVSHSSCRNSYRRSSTITNAMLCAAAAGKDSCSGDSGGPLVCNGKLAGIVSFGIGCARAKYPGVYTDVSKVLTFISRSLERYA